MIVMMVPEIPGAVKKPKTQATEDLIIKSEGQDAGTE
jgi:hypothetical protein